MSGLLDDLRAETASFEALLASLRDDDWDRPTPAEGWAVRDQVSHLAWFDDAAVRAVTDPEAHAAALAAFRSVDDLVLDSRGLSPAELHEWFLTARARGLAAFATLGARDRVPWFGPAMSAASFVTARLMETWAHGQDVADALGVVRKPTARLRHVATIGFRARAYSFAVHGLPEPEEPVRAELTMADGTTWTAGPADAVSVVRGPILDFCLVVTQRIHLADTALELEGEPARAWMPIAQAFAGPPGKGRDPA
ncbi:TIGR03084 family metal-binding protein [Nonomuraea sp. NPDC046802]|uniref:TIGR03084 family metal-binding protein n=1 Tax=Nonomuraea sp. NPDC046802 TaxID=3154919 RepID=UPI003409E692